MTTNERNELLREGSYRYANTDPSRHFNHHVSDECTYQEHDICRDERCACPHHYVVVPARESSPLRSLSAVESEREEWEDYERS